MACRALPLILGLALAAAIGFIVGAACAVMDEPIDPHRRADAINHRYGLQ